MDLFCDNHPLRGKFMKFDMHVHTLQSKRCGWIRPERLIKHAMEIGLDGLAVTDHDTIDGALDVYDMVRDEQLEFEVIIGEEITTDRGEVLAYFINEEIKPGIFKEVLTQIKLAGGISAIPHPFDKKRRQSIHPTKLDVKYVDCIEAFNARCISKKQNEISYNFGIKHNLAITAGSDAHFLNEVGGGGIITEQKDIREAIINKDLTIFGRNSMIINHVGTKLLKLGRNFSEVLR